jgi:hypothetical protein
MRLPTRSLLLLALLAFAGCTKAMDDARRDHVLAGPHGWIDLTLHAPKGAAAAASGAGRTNGDTPCEMRLLVNGEALMDETGDLAQADAAGSPLGYRFVVPAGKLDAELGLSRCVKEMRLPLAVALDKDHLALLEFDGHALSVKSNEPWQPATLEAVRGDVAQVSEHGMATDGTLSTLTRLVAASIVLNLVVLAVLFLRRRG